MAQATLADEKENRRKGIIVSTILHVLLLLLAFLFGFTYDNEKTIDTQFAVQVAFDQKIERSSNSNKASAASGKQRPKSEETRKADTPKPAKKVETKPVTKPTPPKPTPPKPENKVPEIKPTETPKPVDPIETDILTEESEVVAVDDDIPSEDPEPEVVREVEPVEIPTSSPQVEAPSLPSLEDILDRIEEEIVEAGDEEMPSDEPTEDTAEGTGEGGGPNGRDTADAGSGTGDEGEGTGDGNEGDDNDDGIGTGGTGDGDYDDSGRGIFGRAVIYRNIQPILRKASGKSGKIVFKVCVNRQGTVSYRELVEAETTIFDNGILREAFKAVEGYKYQPDPTAPREECGKLSIKVDNFQGFTGP